MKVAVLGGTGSFGRAVAARLVAVGEDEIVIGSRDAARAQEAATELGGRASGGTNEDAVRGADLVVLAVKADGALDTARAVADALGETPLLSVATAIEFRKGVGRCPTRMHAASPSGSRTRLPGRFWPASIRSPRRTSTRRRRMKTH